MIIKQNIITPTTTTRSVSEGNAYLIQLGIQGLPGTEFYLDNNYNNTIQLGFTGIYEINFKDLNILVKTITVKNSTQNVIVDTIWEE